ncbi:hypothetical protein GCM10018793_63750 [Streptomyces sulfonofaciens]|uniref:Bacteriocin fulvocin C-related protein n=1 Tax=Streptomyces sulfonofaciens TaxID=68272 RepID=A0A919GN41_9ACTN|nr:bacteriocin fulvocin C-related protein [Streptomyces sulfonofaciens]GHH87546.1 hypothetical protein GCM10018793_63750 [Streptomyces sulfonofaciens]
MINSSRDAEKWVLAFDASCDTCSAVSAVVADASDGKLEILPLSHPHVQKWRQRAMGPSPKWAPTLLRTRGEDVHAWTGLALSLALARRLGVRSSVRVLRALGELREQVNHDPSEARGAGVNRKKFLYFLGGTAAAIGLTATGQTSAFAKASENSKAHAWVQQNLSELPRTYEEITQYTIPYRRAIYQELSQHERSEAWLQHFRRFRAEHPDLSAKQERVIQELVDVTPKVFAEPGVHTAELSDITEAARRAFGPEEAAALMAQLGPDDGQSIRTANCQCSTVSDYCSGILFCEAIGCYASSTGCGSLYQYRCDGICNSL